MAIELTTEQQQLREEIEQNLAITREALHEHRDDNGAFDRMAAAAHQLHISLSPAPTHHGYMLRNRGVQPEDPAFYQHIHPVEDLLKYLDDPTANDDPADQTLGDTFTLVVYSNRWGHTDNYEIVRNAEGWHVSHLSLSEQGGKDAMGGLDVVLRQDYISYPYNLGFVMESLWEQAATRGLSHEQVQERLNEIANWINATERSYPDFAE
ncbi:hypothetical protein QEZ44_23775 [Bacillus cereus]|uniref:hypothetical protein n=1 Tax=Bacillus cereus TaxID=1396 RepID=UPI00245284FC|nr:hypothetical protein [Bacillus cereus]MDH4424331.1 hypothetical protein [Bacillus cereus]